MAMDYVRTDGKNEVFIENCRLLDMDLDRSVGRQIKREKYQKFNQLDEIREAIVVYDHGRAVGGGAIRRYDDENIVLKGVLVHNEYQGQGVGNRLVSLLIEGVAELGYRRVILGPGVALAAACGGYEILGCGGVAH